MGETTPENPWWCYGGQHVDMQKYKAPEELKCDQFRQWQTKEEMGL